MSIKQKKRALIISSGLVQDQEFVYPFYRLLEEQFTVDVSLFENSVVKGILGINIPPNKDHPLISIDNVNPEDYDFLVLPGGVKSMEKLRLKKTVLDIISKLDDKGVTIASICSAAQLLISAKVVKNRKIAGYYSMKDDLLNAGAIYTDLPAVIDKNIISTAHYKDLGPWMKASLSVYYQNTLK